MAFRCCAVQWKPISRNWLPLYYTTSECHEWLYGAISRLMIADFFDISAENRCLYVCQFVTREPKLVRFIGSFEKSRVREIGGKIVELEWSKSKGNKVWFEISRGSGNRGFEKSGFHCTARHLNALTDYMELLVVRLMGTDFFDISAENRCLYV